MVDADTETLYTAMLEGSITLDRHGIWYHNGDVLKHKRLAQFLHRHVVWDKELETYVIRYGKGRATFSYDRCVYFVKALDTNTSPFSITLLDDTSEELNYHSLRIDSAHRIYCTVKGGHDACFLRSPHQVLLQYAVSDHSLYLDGSNIPLSSYGDHE